MKIISVILTWNNLSFLKCSLKQALDFCDETIVVEGCHSMAYPKQSTDGTYEYLKEFEHPKLTKIFDFDRGGINHNVQREIREKISKQSRFWQPGNWIHQWDDDMFFLDADLVKIRSLLKETKEDSLAFTGRKFIYNFRFNVRVNYSVGFYGITEGCYYKPGYGNCLCYVDGRKYRDYHNVMDGIEYFHFSHVKKPERMKARWVMSMEKGTKDSADRFDKWMSVKWENDRDIFKHKETIYSIIGDPQEPWKERLNIHRAKLPEVLNSHPWKDIEDCRVLT